MSRSSAVSVVLLVVLCAAPLPVSAISATPSVSLTSDPYGGNPLPVWSGEQFTLVADGSCTYDTETQQQINSGELLVSEEYLWDEYPAVCDTAPAEGESETFHYMPEDSGVHQTISVTYVVTLARSSSDEAWSFTDSASLSIKVRKLVVEIVQPPSVSFDATAGQAITFEAKATALPDGEVTEGCAWDWDFGDNSTHSNQNPAQHAYAEGGFYQLLVEGTYDGQQAEAEMPVAVSDQIPPEGGASFYLIDPSNATVASDISTFHLELRGDTGTYKTWLYGIEYRKVTTPESQWYAFEGTPFTYDSRDLQWNTLSSWFDSQDGFFEFRITCFLYWSWAVGYVGPDPPENCFVIRKTFRVKNTSVHGDDHVLKFDPDNHGDCELNYEICHADPIPECDFAYPPPGPKLEWAIQGYESTGYLGGNQTDVWQHMKDANYSKGIYPYLVKADQKDTDFFYSWIGLLENGMCSDTDKMQWYPASVSITSIEKLAGVGDDWGWRVTLNCSVPGDADRVKVDLYSPDLELRKTVWLGADRDGRVRGGYSGTRQVAVRLSPSAAAGTWTAIMGGWQTLTQGLDNRDYLPKPFVQAKGTRLVLPPSVSWKSSNWWYNNPDDGGSQLDWWQEHLKDGTAYNASVFTALPSRSAVLAALHNEAVLLLESHTAGEGAGAGEISISGGLLYAETPAGGLQTGDLALDAFEDAECSQLLFAAIVGCASGSDGANGNLVEQMRRIGAGTALGFSDTIYTGQPSGIWINAFYWGTCREGKTIGQAAVDAAEQVHYTYNPPNYWGYDSKVIEGNTSRLLIPARWGP